MAEQDGAAPNGTTDELLDDQLVFGDEENLEDDLEDNLEDTDTDTSGEEPDGPSKLILGKFKSAKDLEKAYAELERQFHENRQAKDRDAQRLTPEQEKQQQLARLAPRVQAKVNRYGLSEEEAWAEVFDEEAQRQAQQEQFMDMLGSVAGSTPYMADVRRIVTEQGVGNVVTDTEVADYISAEIPLKQWRGMTADQKANVVNVAANALIGHKYRTGTLKSGTKAAPSQSAPSVGPRQATPRTAQDTPLTPRMQQKVEFLQKTFNLPKDRAIAAAKRSEGKR